MVPDGTCCSCLKLVLYCFHSNISPLTKFLKTQKLKIFAIGRLWLVGLVGRKMAVGISNSFYVVFGQLLAPIPNFIQIRLKTQKLKIFTIDWFWLVRLVIRKMVAATSIIQFLFGWLRIISLLSLNSIG